MYGSPIGSIRTGMITSAGGRASGETDFRAFELSPAFGGFSAIPAHAEAFFTDRDTIFSDCKVVFINWWPAAFIVQVNEWLDAVVAAVFVISHAVVCGIKEQLVNMRFGKELFHRKPVIKEAM